MKNSLEELPHYLFSPNSTKQDLKKWVKLFNHAYQKTNEQLGDLKCHYPNSSLTHKIARCTKRVRHADACDHQPCSEACFIGRRGEAIAAPLSVLVPQSNLDNPAMTLSFAIEDQSAPLRGLEAMDLPRAAQSAISVLASLGQEPKALTATGLLDAALVRSDGRPVWRIFARALIVFSSLPNVEEVYAESLILKRFSALVPALFMPEVGDRSEYARWGCLKPLPEGSAVKIVGDEELDWQPLTGLAAAEYALWLDANPMAGRLINFASRSD